MCIFATKTRTLTNNPYDKERLCAADDDNVNWATGTSGIPSGWTVIEE